METVGFVDLGVKARPNLVVLKRTRMPAVLVEAGFINSDTDNELFDSNFQDIAQAIATGVRIHWKCRSSERTGNAGGTDEVPYSGRTVPEPEPMQRGSRKHWKTVDFRHI